eukprot:364692-Chlamydomonas_euryale.AAC.22
MAALKAARVGAPRAWRRRRVGSGRRSRVACSFLEPGSRSARRHQADPPEEGVKGFDVARGWRAARSRAACWLRIRTPQLLQQRQPADGAVVAAGDV